MKIGDQVLLCHQRVRCFKHQLSGTPSFPANNAKLARKLHNYSIWWNSVSHDLTGTNLLPLDINDQDDLEMIKLAWYSENVNRPQLGPDIEVLFDLDSLGPEAETVIFTEAPYWAAGGGAYAISVYYNTYNFYEYAYGQNQYGIHKDFGPLAPDYEQGIALHEDGHLYGLAHPPTIYEPSENNWVVNYAVQSLEMYVNIMHQGLLYDYPTDHDGWWTYVYGAVKREANYYISFEDAGTYRILARARDLLSRQSIIPTAVITVNNWP